MIKSEGNPKLLFFNKLYNRKEILHFVSTRIGGMSKHPFSTLNLSYSSGDSKKLVDKNWQLVKTSLNIPDHYHLILDQIHSDIVITINDYSELNSNSLEGDAVITDLKRVLINILTADCVPVLLYDPAQRIIGAIHAGWRGIIKKIVKKAVLTMKKDFHSFSENIIACIGPSIGPCCYEVKEDVSSIFLQVYPEAVEYRNGNIYLNLIHAVKEQLIDEGVTEKNIETSDICTKCNSDIFYSSRAARNLPTGRFATGIMLV